MIYLILTIILILPAAAAGYCFAKKRSFAESLVMSALFCVAGILVLIAWVNKIYPGGTVMLITGAVQGWTGYIKDTLTQSFVRLNMETIGRELVTPDFMSGLPGALLSQLPSTVITAAVVYCYVDMRLIRRIRQLFGLNNDSMKSFAEFKASRGMCNIALLTMFLTMFGSDSMFNQTLRNIYYLTYTAIGICGFSYVDSMFRKAIPATALRVLIYLVAAAMLFPLIPLAFYGMAFVGIFDAFRDFRKLDKTEEQT